ncbi:helix-turn-helix transcriptional regulator [Streptomyces sp. A1-5]|uniref:helix-turn-helix transcriptional regulator n=1 Tax=Streptomyces sp. A1-5 TaxID=2738410 RepID=UPI001F2769E9|nr:helix-turn-helix transcriptional regulator [Streptomyces sp. A1-5]
MLVERGSQLRALSSRFRKCAEGTGGISLIKGPVGGGKTALLRMFVEDVGARRGVVLEAVASRREMEVPFGVLDQLFRALPCSAEQRRTRALLNDGASKLSDSPSGVGMEYLRNQANRQLWSSLQQLSEKAPVVIAVDDLQYVDLPSLESLLYFAAHLRSARVAIVVTHTECPLSSRNRERTLLVTELLRQPCFDLLRLDPLSTDGVAELLADRTGLVVNRAVARTWHRVSGGSPFLLKALIEDHLAAEPEPGSDPLGEPVVGDEFARATLACLHRGGRWFVRTARLLAVLAESDSADLIYRLFDGSAENAGKMVPAMNAAGVLEAEHFRHPDTRSVVLNELSAADRAELHHCVARLLHKVGADPHRVALHLVATRSTGQPWELPTLIEGAREELHRDDVEFAARCLRLAEGLCETEEQRWEVAVLRVQAEFRVNPTEAMRQLGPLREALRAGRLRHDQMVALLRPLLWHGQREEAVLILDRLARAYDRLDARTAAELYIMRKWLGVTQPRLLATAHPVASIPEQQLPDGARSMIVADPTAHAATLLGRVLEHGPDESTVRTSQWLLETTPLDDGTLCSIQSALLALMYADRLDLAEPWCETWLRETIARRAPTWQALLLSARAEIALRRGDLLATRRHGWSALGLIPRSAWGVSIGSVVGSLVNAATELGETDAPDLRLAEMPDGFFETRSGIQYLYARGRRHLAAHRPQTALDDLLTCGRLMRDWGIDLPAFVPWRTDAVGALLQLGRVAQARELAEEQLSRPAVHQPRVRGMALRALAATQEDLRERVTTLLDSLDALEDGADRVQLAHTLTALADTQRQLGERGNARTSVRRAAQIAEVGKLEPLLRKLARSTDPVMARATVVPHPRQPEPNGAFEDGLSTAERRVAVLAANGRTNREIAKELYITISTVEQHLTRAYRKLRVKGRAGLTSCLHVEDHTGPLNLVRSANQGG